MTLIKETLTDSGGLGASFSARHFVFVSYSLLDSRLQRTSFLTDRVSEEFALGFFITFLTTSFP